MRLPKWPWGGKKKTGSNLSRAYLDERNRMMGERERERKDVLGLGDKTAEKEQAKNKAKEQAAAMEKAKANMAAKEKQAIAMMAEKAATLQFFVEACRKKGLDPKKAFAHYCSELRRDEDVTDQEVVLRMRVNARRKAGENVRFSATGFYARLIVKKYLS
ncbi:MAG: hypothetical protein JW744_02365 [Candidatus Diapherotrites archaeon]|uniref:Uncharacterized protein n=1 Tax=Candidatus Iainarchaeum sp. TaxID=3101447 RepID=A0A938YX39_9ARCH|nr:hypothetical protein [Candidatus Diapherotrites archaeon]